MRWSLKVGRVAGTDLRVHVTFVLLLAWIGIETAIRGGAAAAVNGVGLVLLLFGSVLLHELGHAGIARRFGIATPDITLLPIGGVARIQRIPREPRQEMAIALAGPVVTLLIAASLWGIVGWPHGAAGTPGYVAGARGMAQQVMVANVVLLAFNLLPAFPMDGGRVLRALLATRMEYLRATQIAASVGQAFAFLFGFLGLFGNPLLVFVALFVYLSAREEAASTQLRALAEGLPVSAAMMTDVRSLDPADSLADAVDALLDGAQHDFPVVDDTGRLAGLLSRADLVQALASEGVDAPVRDAMRTGVPSVRSDAVLDQAFRAMEERRCPALPVVDEAGRVVGLVTPDNVGELVMVHGILSGGARPGWHRRERSGARPAVIAG